MEGSARPWMTSETACFCWSTWTLLHHPEIDPSKGTKRFHNGTWYYFDSLDCRMRFVSNPDEYAKA